MLVLRNATKRPWKVFEPTADNPSRAMVAACDGQVTIYDAPLTTETKANAVLIAAAPDMAETIDACDTAFAVISICDDLTPQARGALKEAWHAVQSVLSTLNGPESAYAMAVAENRAAGVAP